MFTVKEVAPKIGEVRIGANAMKYTWHACIDCGKERWVRLEKGQPRDIRCFICGSHNRLDGRYKGGRRVNKYGYISIRLRPNDFFYPMANKYEWVYEHRLIMAKHLCRCLLPWEIVHHKNGLKQDNRIQNLELLAGSKYHLIDMATKRQISRLEKEITEQAKEIKLLQWQIKELEAQRRVA